VGGSVTVSEEVDNQDASEGERIEKARSLRCGRKDCAKVLLLSFCCLCIHRIQFNLLSSLNEPHVNHQCTPSAICSSCRSLF
jgi:hypothetical protein